MTADPLVRASLAGTAVFAVAAVATAAAPDTFGVPYVVVDLALFAGGCAAFVAALLRAAARSRTEALDLAGLFWLTGATAPKPVRRALLGLFGLQVVVAVAAAIAQSDTVMAFGVLVPVYGLGLAGLWGARSGTFPPRASRPPV